MHNHAPIAVAAAVVLLLILFRPRRDGGETIIVRDSPLVPLGVMLAAADVLIYARKHPAAADVPRPAVTHVVTRYVPLHNWPVSGFELTLLGLAVIAAAVLIVRLIGRYFGR